MYCILCSIPLNDTNQEGLLCHGCKHAQRKRRIIRELVIQVSYCLTCGQAYRPADASIQHLTCWKRERLEIPASGGNEMRQSTKPGWCHEREKERVP